MKRITARDVAEYVGCSVSAVSLVVNGHHEGRINQELRERILQAVELLNYRPNESARNLATRSPSNIALVCPDIRNPFFGELFHGLAQSLRGSFGVDLRVGPEGADYDASTVRSAQAGDIGGIVLANPSQEVLSSFQATCPTVLVDSPDSQLDIVRVDLDTISAARQLAEHLLERGHRRVGYVDLRRSKDTFVQRRKSLAATLEAGGGQLRAIVSAPDITISSGVDAFRSIWPAWQSDEITAIVCADDVLAFGVVSGARQSGISIPGELSIASFNDIPFSELLEPSLTSVHLAAFDVGHEAGLKVLDLIQGGSPESVVLATELRIRASTGQARNFR